MPTPEKAARVRESSIARALKDNRIRKTDAATVLAALHATLVTVAPGSTEAATAHIRNLINRIRLVDSQLVQGIGPAPAARRLLLQRQARIIFDPVGGRGREARLGCGGLGGKGLSRTHVQPHLVVGDMEAGQSVISLDSETNQQLGRAPPDRQTALKSAPPDVAGLRSGYPGGMRLRRRTLSLYLTKLARLGGYLASANDPPPGNIVMWRGLARLADIQIGVEIGAEECG